MTNVLAIHSVGESLRTSLENAYPEALQESHKCVFKLISSGELAAADDIDNALSLYLYRVTMNEHLRSTPRQTGPAEENTPLAVDLHYLLTVWAKSAFSEHVILAWAMRELQQHPVLDRSSLSPEADWGPGDFIHVIPAELSNEDVMRIWDALEPSYRLSVSYVARVVRIDTDSRVVGLPTVATRIGIPAEREGPR